MSFWTDPGGSISGTLNHWGNAIDSAAGKLGSWVDNNIPGGWGGITAGALMAVGIYDPELLGLADAGALTPTALTSAGVDAAATQTGLAGLVSGATGTSLATIGTGALQGGALGGAISAATGHQNLTKGILLGALGGGLSSVVSGAIGGAAPGLTALEHAIATGAVTGAATSAAAGGSPAKGALLGGAGAGIWSIGSSAFSSANTTPAPENVPDGAQVVNSEGQVGVVRNGEIQIDDTAQAIVTSDGLVLQDAGGQNLLNSTNDTYTLQNSGYDNMQDYTDGMSKGYQTGADYTAGQAGGFSNAAQYQAATDAGFTNAQDYTAATSAGFNDASEYLHATSAGFTNAATYNAATSAGFTNATDYADATANGYTNANAYDNAWNEANKAGFDNVADYKAATAVGIDNATDYTNYLNSGKTPDQWNQINQPFGGEKNPYNWQVKNVNGQEAYIDPNTGEAYGASGKLIIPSTTPVAPSGPTSLPDTVPQGSIYFGPGVAGPTAGYFAPDGSQYDATGNMISGPNASNAQDYNFFSSHGYGTALPGGAAPAPTTPAPVAPVEPAPPTNPTEPPAPTTPAPVAPVEPPAATLPGISTGPITPTSAPVTTTPTNPTDITAPLPESGITPAAPVAPAPTTPTPASTVWSTGFPDPSGNSQDMGMLSYKSDGTYSWSDNNGQNVYNSADQSTWTPAGPPAGTVPVQGANGETLYTDGKNYYNADGTVNTTAGSTTPVQGPGTQVAGPGGYDQKYADLSNTYQHDPSPANAAALDAYLQSIGSDLTHDDFAPVSSTAPAAPVVTQPAPEVPPVTPPTAPETPVIPVTPPAATPVSTGTVTEPITPISTPVTAPVDTTTGPINPVTNSPVTTPTAPVSTAPVDTTTGPINPEPTPAPAPTPTPTPTPEPPLSNLPTGPGNANPPGSPVTGVDTSYVDPQGNPVDTSGWSAWQIAAGIAGGMLLSSMLFAPTGGGGSGYAGESPWKWGTATPPVNPGINPGYIAGSTTPLYNTTSPDQAQYAWGVHPAVTSINNVSGQLNAINAPATPFGAATSAVGGTQSLNIPQMLQQLYTPQYSASAFGAPGQPYTNQNYNNFSTPASYSTTAIQTITNPTHGTFGGPQMAPQNYAPTYVGLPVTTGVPFIPSTNTAYAPVTPVAPT